MRSDSGEKPRRSLLALIVFIAAGAGVAAAQQSAERPVARDDVLTLVRVNLITEARGPSEPVVIDGKIIPGYRPKVIQVFPSTGVVMDDDVHVMTFLGYRYVYLQQADPRIDIVTWRGEKYRGKLIGVDHALGVAVVRSSGGKLRRTLICRDCGIRGGENVVAHFLEPEGEAQFLNARVLSVVNGSDTGISGSWDITFNRRLPGVGDALLDRDFRVLGFVASQEPSRLDPMGARTLTYPIAELLDSAHRIIRAGGNIRNGWLGVYPDDSPRPAASGVMIKGVKEGSPAQKAGLRPLDTIVSWNGKDIRGEWQLIRAVQDTPVGSKVALGVLRQGRPVDLSAVIESRQAPEGPDGRFAFSFMDQMLRAGLGYGVDAPPPADEASVWAGIETAPLTPQMADFLKIPVHTGVLVLNVDSSMPFSNAGIQAGDVILAVNGESVDNPQTFFAHLRSHGRNAQQVILKMIRKGVEHITTIQLPMSSPRRQK